MLTKSDLDQIKEVINNRLDEKIKHLPTKDEFFQTMDKVFGELQTIRDELKISHRRIDDHEERITDLENNSSRPQMVRDSED